MTRRTGTDLALARLVALAGLCGFLVMAAAAFDLVPHGFDTTILLALRETGAPDQPIGPAWLPGAVRDVTALGSTVVLACLTVAAVIWLWIARQRDKALLMFVAMAGGQALGAVIKLAVHRPRPSVVPHLVTETSLSFPSGHAMMSAVAYLTLALLAAGVLQSSTARFFLLLLAVLTTFAIGVSRLYLGVHWPSDVMAGWCIGTAWAMVCWLAAKRLGGLGASGSAH
ncbi:MAG: phosphatase PAP2 family protein [Mesorhizobium sp.]|nr:phosphatase PAP2 family protein [Mesorhizobium sp.]MBN9241749.1 phosphatase PAP2 family protein [Mesorhizobium sp.]